MVAVAAAVVIMLAAAAAAAALVMMLPVGTVAAGMSEVTIGLIFSAAGTSFPDFLASLIVARKGAVDMVTAGTARAEAWGEARACGEACGEGRGAPETADCNRCIGGGSPPPPASSPRLVAAAHLGGYTAGSRRAAAGCTLSPVAGRSAARRSSSQAVSNAFGSNIFDILLGLGFPW